jgi:hypothetical protein
MECTVDRNGQISKKIFADHVIKTDMIICILSTYTMNLLIEEVNFGLILNIGSGGLPINGRFLFF